MLNITSISSELPAFDISGAPRAIAPGETEVFSIVFNPATEGHHTSVITIDSDSRTHDPYNFTVTGYGWDNVSPRISVSGQGNEGAVDYFLLGYNPLWQPIQPQDPDTRFGNGTDFRSVNLDVGPYHLVYYRERTNFYRISNDGAEPLVIESITENSPHYQINKFYDNGDVGSLSDGETLSATIQPGLDSKFAVKFRPFAYGIQEAEIEIAHNGPANNPFIIPITGFADTSDGPEFHIQGTWLGRLRRMAAPAGTSPTYDVPVYNAGNEILIIDNISSSDPTNFEITGAPSILGPGEIGTLSLTAHAPATNGTQIEGTISMDTNDPDGDEDPVVINLSIRAGNPHLEVVHEGYYISNDPTRAPTLNSGTDFGIHSPGDPAIVRSFDLRNRDNASTLTIVSIGIGSPSFFIEGVPSTLGPNETGTLVIRYQPVAGGIDTPLVTIESNDPYNVPYEFPITGTSTAPIPLPDITNFAWLGDHAIVSFQSYVSKSYRLMHAPHPIGPWTLVPESFPFLYRTSGIVGNGTEMNVIVLDAFDLHRAFYRIEEEK